MCLYFRIEKRLPEEPLRILFASSRTVQKADRSRYGSVVQVYNGQPQILLLMNNVPHLLAPKDLLTPKSYGSQIKKKKTGVLKTGLFRPSGQALLCVTAAVK